MTSKIIKNLSEDIIYHETYEFFADKVKKIIHGDSSSPTVISVENYDKYGRRISSGPVVNDTEQLSTYTLDYVGNVLTERTIKTNSAEGSNVYSKQYTYDLNGNILTEKDILGNQVTYQYDGLGRKVSYRDARSHSTAIDYRTLYEYDALGRVVRIITPMTSTANAITEYEYDNSGNITKELTSNNLPGQVIHYTQKKYSYDNRNRLIKIESFDNGTIAQKVEYTYDVSGNRTQMVINETQTTSYSYDRHGNVISTTNPLGEVEECEYDRLGNLIRKVEFNGAIVSCQYNCLSKLVVQAVTKADKTQSLSYNYAANGELVRAENENVSIDYRYDTLGNLVKEIQSDGVVISRNYDFDRNLTSITTEKDGTLISKVIYAYDRANRLITVSNGTDINARYLYDANGNRSKLFQGDGIVSEYSYNLGNLITNLTTKIGEITDVYSYSYYLDGNQATKIEPSGTTTYQYG